MLRTAVIGVGSLGKQHARIHSDLATEGVSEFVAVCDLNEETARSISGERKTDWTTDWRELIGRIDAASIAVPTEAHCEIACGLLEAGIHVLVEKPISRTLEEADWMIEAAERGKAILQVGHLERFNPAMVALRPHVRKPVYFEIHRVGQFTARSLDIDVVLDLMIHDLDIVQWLVGEDVEVTSIHAVGIAILTNKSTQPTRGSSFPPERWRTSLHRASEWTRFARCVSSSRTTTSPSTTQLNALRSAVFRRRLKVARGPVCTSSILISSMWNRCARR